MSKPKRIAVQCEKCAREVTLEAVLETYEHVGEVAAYDGRPLICPYHESVRYYLRRLPLRGGAMDPDAMAKALIDAYKEQDYGRAAFLADELANWIERGGFEPDGLFELGLAVGWPTMHWSDLRKLAVRWREM